MLVDPLATPRAIPSLHVSYYVGVSKEGDFRFAVPVDRYETAWLIPAQGATLLIRSTREGDGRFRRS
jgi:hypothetical protein